MWVRIRIWFTRLERENSGLQGFESGFTGYCIWKWFKSDGLLRIIIANSNNFKVGLEAVG